MTIFTDLISNVALLLALSILYSFLTRIWKQGEIPGQILAGILFGGVAVAGMLQPFNYAPGVIFDGRSMVVSMAGLFGGPVTAAISTLIAGGYRLGLGGTGALTGFGVIFTSAALGVGYHYLHHKNPDVTKPSYLFAFGVIVHISMLLWMLTLPWPLAFEVLNKISIPVMLIFPLGTLFLGTLLADQEGRNYAQAALRESEERYREILENVSMGVYQVTLDGKFLFANQKMTEMFGYSSFEELEAIGSIAALYVRSEERHHVVNEIINKGFTNEEIEFRRKDGQSIWVKLHTRKTKNKEGAIILEGLMEDITEKKKLEAQLLQAQKMESMGTLAGGIAHDFNNLLMAIQGRTSIILMNKDSSHPDIKHLKGIEDNVESAAGLTRQLLGFARGGKYEVRPTDLNELIKKQNRMFGRTKKEVSIRGKYEENPWSVEVDQGQIEQVLLNLYVNAWQAMPSGGNLYLETENVTLDETDVKSFAIEPGKYVKISVTDTGVGMDKATREKIFEPFFTTKEMGRGTGLGLASAYGIIKNHGGFINVYSEKGHGTTFNIYLPSSEKEAIEENKPVEDTLRGTETVLLIDDEDMIIEVAEELFDQLGYEVLTAGSGKEAIEIFEENKEHIDIVLLDMIMPDMSGGDTYDRMKAIDPDIKVLLSSGYSINGQATEIMDRGCNGFIQKPFKMKELSQKLRGILDER